MNRNYLEWEPPREADNFKQVIQRGFSFPHSQGWVRPLYSRKFTSSRDLNKTHVKNLIGI